MNRIMTYLRTCLCFLMLLFCCISPVHGFGITAMAAGPGYGPGAYTEQDDAGNDISVPRLKLLFIDRIE